jgi:hypothetical protein
MANEITSGPGDGRGNYPHFFGPDRNAEYACLILVFASVGSLFMLVGGFIWLVFGG